MCRGPFSPIFSGGIAQVAPVGYDLLRALERRQAAGELGEGVFLRLHGTEDLFAFVIDKLDAVAGFHAEALANLNGDNNLALAADLAGNAAFFTSTPKSKDTRLLRVKERGGPAKPSASTRCFPGLASSWFYTIDEMPARLIPTLKATVHLACLVPFFWLLHLYQCGALGLYADPVNYITHFTGDWALWILLVDLAITPVRRLNPALSFLIRFRRMVGLYAFFYATLHLATYVFLFSGYDIPTALAGLKAGRLGVVWAQFMLVWPTMWQDILKRRFIQVGFAAWVILLALALTSPAFIMRGMGGKNWQRLHRLIYLAGWLAVTHYWWLVKKGVSTPWKVTLVLWGLLLARLGYWAMKKVSARRNLVA